jgi:hypothetical protein
MKLEHRAKHAMFFSTAATLAAVSFFSSPASSSAQKVGHALRPVHAHAAPSGSQWLSEINLYRVAAGLVPVSDQASWDAGIVDHLTYLEQTSASFFTGAYVNEHTENPASPSYTSAGAQEGAASDLFPGVAGQSDVAVIDDWLSAPFYAVAMLRPTLGQVAFGDVGGDAGLDVVSGLNQNPASTNPVLFPGSGMTTDLTTYVNELPSPFETCKWSATPTVGLPLIALLSSPPSTGLSATLTSSTTVDETSANATLCIVDATDYTSTDTVYGSTGLSVLQNANAVFLIPKVPLTQGSYTATINQVGQTPITWTFNVDVPPSVATSSLAQAKIGHAYRRALAAKGGQAPYTWSTTGTLPPGFRLTTQGVLEGLVSSKKLVAAYYLQVVVTDASGHASPVRNLILRVNPK